MSAIPSSSSSSIDRPYAARDLTLREVRAGDIHSFLSPKENARLVRVDGLSRIALALLLEFRTDVVAYTERPRTLQVGKARYEICFWFKRRSGEERMVMVITATKQPGLPGKRRVHRQADELMEAARAAHLPLEFVPEADLLAQGPRIALAYRLLPDVQSAMQLANRGLLHDAIVDLLAHHNRLNFSQILTGAGGYQPADVQCVLAYMLHAGTLTCDAGDRLLRSTTFELVP